jgi:hypothetical protein
VGETGGECELPLLSLDRLITFRCENSRTLLELSAQSCGWNVASRASSIWNAELMPSSSPVTSLPPELKRMLHKFLQAIRNKLATWSRRSQSCALAASRSSRRRGAFRGYEMKQTRLWFLISHICSSIFHPMVSHTHTGRYVHDFRFLAFFRNLNGF